MPFPIGAVFAGASFLLERLPGILSTFGASAPPEAISGARLALALGPKAIEFLEDLKSTSPDVHARWAEARQAVMEGNQAWEDAGKPA